MGFLKKIFGSESEEYDEGSVEQEDNEIKEVDLEPESELSNELKERITNLLKKGKTKNDIKKSLIVLGYGEKEIEKFILSLTKISKAEDLYALSGNAFEEFLSDLFSHLGYSSVTTKTTGDQGGDLVIEKNGDRIVVQAKNFSGNLVGNKAIQEVFASKSYYDCNKTMVVTTSSFTKSAIELAHKNNIELWDKNKLNGIIKETNFSWLPKESHFRKDTVVRIPKTYVENHPFSIGVRYIKVLTNMAYIDNIGQARNKAPDLVKVGFEIKNISDSDWGIGCDKAFIVDGSNKQCRNVKTTFEEEDELNLNSFDFPELYSESGLNFYLLFYKKKMSQGIRRIVLNITYIPPGAHHKGTFNPELKIFKIEMN